jgi:hypothetical protein
MATRIGRLFLLLSALVVALSVQAGSNCASSHRHRRRSRFQWRGTIASSPTGRQVVTPEGVLPARKSCQSCHTRYLPAGTVLDGAPANHQGAGMQRLRNSIDGVLGPFTLGGHRSRTRDADASRYRPLQVPSLKGLWYRGLLGRRGDVATLEDWFDRARLRDDYVPSGWKASRRQIAPCLAMNSGWTSLIAINAR